MIVTTILPQDKVQALFNKSKWHCTRHPIGHRYTVRTALYLVRFTVLFDADITVYPDENGRPRAKYHGSSFTKLPLEFLQVIEARYGIKITNERSFPVGRMNACLMGGDTKAFKLNLYDFLVTDLLDSFEYVCSEDNTNGEYSIREYIAHHVNEDTTDDRISNIQIMTREEHARHHCETEYGELVNEETGEVYIKGYIDWSLLNKRRGSQTLSNLAGAALIKVHKALRRETYKGTIHEFGIVNIGDLELCLSG